MTTAGDYYLEDDEIAAGGEPTSIAVAFDVAAELQRLRAELAQARIEQAFLAMHLRSGSTWTEAYDDPHGSSQTRAALMTANAMAITEEDLGA